jgi:ribose 1,5-bisphosphate isomerase
MPKRSGSSCNLDPVVRDIRSVKVQGAKNIAIFALKFLRKFAKKYGFGLKFEVAAQILEETRPTAVVLHNCIDAIKKRPKISTIDSLLRQLESSTEMMGKNGSRLIKSGYRIMVHCHSSEALSVIKHAWKQKKKIQVYATQTEPLEQGVMTAKELQKAGIPVTLICDSSVSFFMKEVDCVIVGADAIREVPPYGVVNKIGTLNLALAAREYKKPFYVIGGTLKIDRRKKFKIEERPADELYRHLLRPMRQKIIKVRNPAFDLVPFRLVTKIVNEKGVYSPKGLKKLK